MTGRTKYEVGMCVLWAAAAVFFLVFGSTIPGLVLAGILPFRIGAAYFIIREEKQYA